MTITLRTFLLINVIFVFSELTTAQTEFIDKEGSKNYYAKITVNKFVNNDCSGPGTITLYEKSSNKKIQTFKTDNICFYVEGNSSPMNGTELHGGESPLIFDDFNFDGYEDIAINSGNYGSYGTSSYDVYLFSKASENFVLNSALTTIASENLGMFDSDKNTKRIRTYNKSGCCWHITTEYEIRNNVLLKTYELEEDATVGNDLIVVTERKLVNNSWKSEVKTYNIDDYYKDK